MTQRKRTLRTISEINGLLDDFSSSFSLDDSESEDKCYIDFSCNDFSKNSKKKNFTKTQDVFSESMSSFLRQ